jgi:hypothetical protein
VGNYRQREIRPRASDKDFFDHKHIEGLCEHSCLNKYVLHTSRLFSDL